MNEIQSGHQMENGLHSSQIKQAKMKSILYLKMGKEKLYNLLSIAIIINMKLNGRQTAKKFFGTIDYKDYSLLILKQKK